MSAAANKQLMQEIFATAGNPDPAVRDRSLFVASLADDARWVVTGQYSWSCTFIGREAILNDLHGHVRSLLVERLRQRPAQRLGPRRQFHARADTDQQGIAEHLAQPLQSVARGGLRQANPHRGAADIGFQQQRVERDQQIQVERIQIHYVNIYHIHYRLEECRWFGP